MMPFFLPHSVKLGLDMKSKDERPTHVQNSGSVDYLQIGHQSARLQDRHIKQPSVDVWIDRSFMCSGLHNWLKCGLMIIAIHGSSNACLTAWVLYSVWPFLGSAQGKGRICFRRKIEWFKGQFPCRLVCFHFGQSMVAMLYICLLLAFDVTTLAERSERWDYGDLSLAEVHSSVTACRGLIWDKHTIKKRKRRRMSIGKAGHILEDRLLACLTFLKFRAFRAEGFHPEDSLYREMRFVKNPEECRPRGGPVALAVLDPSKKDDRSIESDIEFIGQDGQDPQENQAMATSSIFECWQYPTHKELRRCFHGALSHGETPLKFKGADIYNASAIFIKFDWEGHVRAEKSVVAFCI